MDSRNLYTVKVFQGEKLHTDNDGPVGTRKIDDQYPNMINAGIIGVSNRRFVINS